MRISVNYDFERRVGLFPAGFRQGRRALLQPEFADYPQRIPAGKFNAASQQPEWMLLSYKSRSASSTAENSSPGAGSQRGLPQLVERRRCRAGRMALRGLGKE